MNILQKDGELAICNIKAMERFSTEVNVIRNLDPILKYNKRLLISLIFNKRDVRSSETNNFELDHIFKKNKLENKINGDKLISYYMILWLLEHDEELFLENYNTFILSKGYFKDCLNIAMMGKERYLSNYKIDILLSPMAFALLEDTNKIIGNHLLKNANLSINPICISLASKWAPRERKAFGILIPNLKKLCHISGPRSDMKWRKFIQRIVYHKSATIERLLSEKSYDKINFKDVPSKAYKLYNKSFSNIPELSERFAEYKYR